MTDLSKNIVLASASTVRRKLLEAAGLPVTVIPSSVDEAFLKSVQKNGSTASLALTLAEAKAKDVLEKSDLSSETFVIGADQILVADGKRFDKPASLDKAADNLRLLQGKTHELISACVIRRTDGTPWHAISKARLTMRPLSDGFICNYLEQIGDAALTSVGAYQLEGLGAQLFSKIEGDYFTILGLPLLEVLGYLRTQKVLPT